MSSTICHAHTIFIWKRSRNALWMGSPWRATPSPTRRTPRTISSICVQKFWVTGPVKPCDNEKRALPSLQDVKTTGSMMDGHEVSSGWSCILRHQVRRQTLQAQWHFQQPRYRRCSLSLSGEMSGKISRRRLMLVRGQCNTRAHSLRTLLLHRPLFRTMPSRLRAPPRTSLPLHMRPRRRTLTSPRRML